MLYVAVREYASPLGGPRIGPDHPVFFPRCPGTETTGQTCNISRPFVLVFSFTVTYLFAFYSGSMKVFMMPACTVTLRFPQDMDLYINEQIPPFSLAIY